MQAASLDSERTEAYAQGQSDATQLGGSGKRSIQLLNKAYRKREAESKGD